MIWVLLISFLVFIVPLGFYYYYVSQGFWIFSKNAADWANFGSYAAGIFTGITFLALIYQNYSEKKRFKEESNKREEERKKDDFERTFFMMLEHHNNKLSSLNENKVINDVYSMLFQNGSLISVRHIIENNRKDLYSDLNVYFLNLYRILKFIDDNNSLNENLKYSSLLRSFIPRKLIFILSYHLCDRDETYEKYIVLINKFHFLEHVNLSLLECEFVKSILFDEGNNEVICEKISSIVSNCDADIAGLCGRTKDKLEKLIKVKKNLNSNSLGEEDLSLSDNNVFHYIFSKFKKDAFYDENSSLKYHKEKYEDFINTYKHILKLNN